MKPTLTPSACVLGRERWRRLDHRPATDGPSVPARTASSGATVRAHRHRIYTRMGAADRTQAVILRDAAGLDLTRTGVGQMS
jgi:hypothetical protein